MSRRLFFFAIALVVNAMAVFIALAPALVTYAELSPSGVTCPSCSSAEVQQALKQAATVGREQIQSAVRSNFWVLTALGVLNIALVGALLLMLRSNTTVERDARNDSARPSP